MSTAAPIAETAGAASTEHDREGILEAVATTLGMRLGFSSMIHSEASGDGLVTGHRVGLEAPDGTSRTETIYIQDNPPPVAADGVLRMESTEGEQTDVWLYPNDPALPALSAAVFSEAAAVLLKRLGLPHDDLEVNVTAYRPGKRAVVRMVTPTSTVFLKVVKPRVAESLCNRHASWQSAGVPVPRAIAWAPDGLVALDILPGIEAIEVVPRLALDDSFVLAVEALMQSIARVPSDDKARTSLVRRLDWYAAALDAHAPSYQREVAQVRALISARFDRAFPAPELVTVHGDLHLAQVFVDPAAPHRISGVLDIDTAGLGDPADDAAALWAHLIVTSEYRVLSGDLQFAESARMLASRFRSRWPRETDPGFSDRAAAIAATHLLGHALSGRVSVAILLARATDLVS